MVKDIRRLPRLKTRDATHTSLLQNKYYRQLTSLYKQFQINLQPTMTRLFNRSGHEGFVSDFRDRVNAQANGTIGIGAPQIIRDNITQAYIRGKKTAAENPRIRINSIIIPYQLNYTDQRVVEDLIVRNVSLVTKLTEDMKQELIRTLTDGIREQQSIDNMIRAINERIPDITRARAKTIARTEIAYSYVNAHSKAYRGLGIEQWQWMAALGYNCCDECINNHGKVFDFGDPEPPLHPNCLCDIYPIIDKEFK